VTADQQPLIESPGGPTPKWAAALDTRAARRVDVKRLLMSNALLFGIVALICYFGVAGSNFLTTGNFIDILRTSATTIVVAVPITFLLIAGKVDLSIGSTVALGAVLTGVLMTQHHVAPLPASLIGVGAGALVGTVNGVLCTTLRLSPIIVTLGMLTAVRGVTLAIAPNPVFGFGEGFDAFGTTNLIGVPWLVWVAALVVAVGTVVLAMTPFGRHIFAIGNNEEAAYLSGIRSHRAVFIVFVATGAAAGLAGVMFAAQLDSAPSGSLGVGFELTVLTAVLLGGVAFNGGRGSIHGGVLGVLFLVILQNGLTIVNAPTATGSIISGCVLVFAAGLDRAKTSGGSRT